MREQAIHFRGLILAAGKGTRFAGTANPNTPKVLRPLLGRPMICRVIDAMIDAGVSDITAVIGFGGDEVRATLGTRLGYVVQSEQLGSGHAVACAREVFAGFEGALIVMCGDSPLFLADTLRRMMQRHKQTGAAVTLASAVLDEPKGYGRIIRSEAGNIVSIVEEKCACQSVLKIAEVNGGAYVFDAMWLFNEISSLEPNKAGEYNLTDMIKVAVQQGRKVEAETCSPEEVKGVNTAEELIYAENVLRKREPR